MKPHDYLSDSKTPASLRTFLEAALADLPPSSLPELYATTKRAFAGRGAGGTVVGIAEGARVRVIELGKFGDIGITSILDETKRDQARAALAELTNFSARP